MASLKDVADRVTEGKLRDALGAQRAAVSAGKEVKWKGIGDLLSEVGARDSGRGRGSEERHGGGAEDSTASEPDSMGGVMGETETVPGASSESTQSTGMPRPYLFPCIQSKIVRIPYAYNGKCLRRHRHEKEGSAARRAYIHFTGSEKRGPGRL